VGGKPVISIMACKRTAERYIKMSNDIIAMDFTSAYRFRIYSDMKRQKETDEMIFLAQQLYNVVLEKGESGTCFATNGCSGSPEQMDVAHIEAPSVRGGSSLAVNVTFYAKF